MPPSCAEPWRNLMGFPPGCRKLQPNSPACTSYQTTKYKLVLEVHPQELRLHLTCAAAVVSVKPRNAKWPHIVAGQSVKPIIKMG